MMMKMCCIDRSSGCGMVVQMEIEMVVVEE
jgi:hypothetical protein